MMAFRDPKAPFAMAMLGLSGITTVIAAYHVIPVVM